MKKRQFAGLWIERSQQSEELAGFSDFFISIECHEIVDFLTHDIRIFEKRSFYGCICITLRRFGNE